MTTPTSSTVSAPAAPVHHEPEAAPFWKHGWFRNLAIWLVLLGLILVGTRFIKTGTEPSSGPQSTSPTAYAQENYSSKVVPKITETAVDLPALVTALKADKEAAGAKYGHKSGTSPYSFATKFTGTISKSDFGEVTVTVPGVPADTAVGIQTGPAISGTAIRDATGFITFDMFTNQIDYAKVATELNNQMKTDVLAKNKLSDMVGKKVNVVGAFAYDNPAHLLITPVKIEQA